MVHYLVVVELLEHRVLVEVVVLLEQAEHHFTELHQELPEHRELVVLMV
jgi:hypothetical protein